MSTYTNYDKIIGTVNSITSDYSFIPDQDNNICIDTSNNRIGINTVNPKESIDVSGGGIKADSITFTNNLFYVNNDLDISTSIIFKINQMINKINDISPNDVDISLI